MGHNQVGRFTKTAIKTIEASLPPPLPRRRWTQLFNVFREWERTELQEHLSMPSRAAINAGIKQFNSIKIKATELSQAITALDQHGRLSVLSRMEIEPATKRGFSQRAKQLDEIHKAIRSLAELAPNPRWKFKCGQPRNLAAYLVLQDAVAIYEWWSGEQATREVDRDSHREIGPFFRFVSTLWPLIFGKDVKGLPAAMKNWESWCDKPEDRSPLIANLNLRHPAWRLLERQPMKSPLVTSHRDLR